MIQSIEMSCWLDNVSQTTITACILCMEVTLNHKHVGRVGKNVHAPLPVAQPPGSAAGHCWSAAAASAAGSTERHLAAAVMPAEPADSKRKCKWLIWKQGPTKWMEKEIREKRAKGNTWKGNREKTKWIKLRRGEIKANLRIKTGRSIRGIREVNTSKVCIMTVFSGVRRDKDFDFRTGS